MNKKKQIKELEERVAQLEQQVEMLDARRNIWCWPPPLNWQWGTYDPSQPYSPITISGACFADELEK